MKKYALLVLILFLIGLTAPALQSAPVQVSVVPENAKWFIHIDVQKLAKTELKKAWLDKSLSDFKKEIAEIERRGQIDFFKDIAHVTVIGMGKDEAVVSFSGKWKKDHLVSLLKESESPREMRYGEYLIYNWGNEFGVFVNNKLVLISGSESSIKNVLDTVSGKIKNISASPALAGQLKSLAPENFLTAVSVKLNEMINSNDFPSAVLKNSKGAFFSVAEVGDKLQVALSLETDSYETAQNLSDVFKGLKSLLAMQNKVDADWNLVKSLKMNVQGSFFTLETEALVEEILRLIN